jgi:FMN phosphatase YigB (HAD superfamily)
MTNMHDLIFLFDVDNTLLDNDRVEADLAAHLTGAYGAEAANRYRDIFEKLRQELGYADYLGALERFRLEKMHDPRVLQMSSWLVDYPFADRLYAGALDVIMHVQQWGPAVILSDGDAVFPQNLAGGQSADIQLDHLGDLNKYALAAFMTASGRRNHASNKSTA